MVFGAVIDVPLLVGTFVIMFLVRKRVARALHGPKVPPFLLFLLISVPLIVVEEDIDCMPAWCSQVIVPPTLPFLLLEIFIIGVVAVVFRVRRVVPVVLAYCVFGVGLEMTVGGLRGATPLVDRFVAPYVALGYAYVSMLPLEVLVNRRGTPWSPPQIAS